MTSKLFTRFSPYLAILFLLGFQSLTAQTYNFNSDTEGALPANVAQGNNGTTTNDGTVVVSGYDTTDRGMEATAKGSKNTAVVDMSLFSSDSDYSITWKETYTTARRSGFILRANGTTPSDAYTGVKQGYLFQVNGEGIPAANTLRIYVVTASGFGTQIKEVSLTAPGTNIARWYRATVNGDALKFDYSTDGITWINKIETTNTTHASGTVQYTQGFGAETGGLYVDDITKEGVDGFTLSETTLSIGENAGTDSFTAVLNTQPTNDVVINFTSDNINKLTVSPSSYTFTSTDWNTPKIVTITGVNDDLATPNDPVTITANVDDAASDNNFDGVPDQSVSITVTNDDITSLIYDFESPNTINNPPLNITATNGTSKVVTGQAMEILTSSEENTAVFTLDLISTAYADYSVTWKENYTTAGRSGVILRGTSSINAITPGAKFGYLVQVSPSANDARIYTSDASTGGYTKLISTHLLAPGSGVDRWYRATIIGSTISFEYSNDGTNFNTVHSVVNSTYPNAGVTQFVRGYGGTIAGLKVDDISYGNTQVNTNEIQITNINEYQVFQRDGADQADIAISGTYTGTPTSIEASFNGSSFVTIDSSPAGNTFSGTLNNQATGQGILTVRFTNETTISSNINNVGIGDIFIIAGQSNASGRGNTLNNYSHASLKATLFGNDDNWKELADEVDSNAGQIDGVSSDGIAKGTPWPLIATDIMAAEGIPIAFVPTAKGGTSISQWQPGTNHSNASTLYGSMNRRISAVGGKVKGILFFQGESDSSNGVTQANYETGLNTFVNTVENDFSGTKTLIGQIGHSGFAGNDKIRAGQISVINSNPNALLGPATYDIDLSDGDTLHFKSDPAMQEFARRWYLAINKEFYSGSNGYGPILSDPELVYDSALNKIQLVFTDDTSTVINPASTVTSSSFKLTNNGNVAISAINIVNNTIEITPTSTLNTGQPILLTYASLNTAISKAIYDNDNLPAQPFYNKTVNVGTLSVESLLLNKSITLYPNCSTSILKLKNNNEFSINSIEIFNIQGRLIQQSGSINPNDLCEIDISYLKDGLYFLRIGTKIGNITKKFIKESNLN
ncbi:sialate O-acetylesterase [Lutibacter citreus]|uniref:sialate O-acetylesterase n=1 Tax=Lutibacter citreus TaxID=2138210 RepID=UPI000DBE4773|nr:sialate O-acetylesterase [Lutibacter citreus]